VILGFYAGKFHNLIGLGIFHGDLDFFDLHEKSIHLHQKSLDLHEKSLDLSNYEIFPHKILKSRTFKKSSILIVNLLFIYGEPFVVKRHTFRKAYSIYFAHKNKLRSRNAVNLT
jgi:hypothetical protein